MDCSKTDLHVPHHLPEFAQVHVHYIGDAIQPSHPLSSPSPSALNLSRHRGLFQWVNYLHPVAKTGTSASASVLPVSIQGWFPLRWTGLISLLSKGLSGVFSSTTVQRHQFFGALPSLRFSSNNCTWPLETPCVCAKSIQPGPTLCNRMDCILPGSLVHGILQTRILERVAMPSSRGPSWPTSPALAGSSLPLAPPGKPQKRCETNLTTTSSRYLNLKKKASQLISYLMCWKTRIWKYHPQSRK